MFKFFPLKKISSVAFDNIKGSGLFFSGYDLPFIKRIQPLWNTIGPYAKARANTRSTKINVREADVEELKFLHAFGPFRLQSFTSMEEYMRKEAIPIGVSILEGSGGLGGKNTAFYTHSIGPDNYKYSYLFEIVAQFFSPKDKKPAVIFISKDVLPSTLQPGIKGGQEAIWFIPSDSPITHVPINPIIWHDGNYDPKFTVHSPEILALWLKDILCGLDSAKKGVVEVADALHLETSEKGTAELLNEIQIKIFTMIRSKYNQPNNVLANNEELVQTQTYDTLTNAYVILSQFEKILENSNVRSAFPENISELLKITKEQLKPIEAEDLVSQPKI